jgi:uncharacterized protein (UPF0276 family)
VKPPLIGIALQPEERFWQHARTLIEERAELFEITPETLWNADCAPNPGHARLLAFAQRCGRPFAGHGTLFSLGAAERPARRDRWLGALRRDAQLFRFEWLSEHLGFADVAGGHTAWPLALPPTDEAVATVASSLEELRTVCPTVGFENNADLFCFGDPLAQPPFFGSICEAADAHVLLDLHNAFAFCRNLGVPLDAWLEALPWDRVLEIHLSGGSESDPDWLPDFPPDRRHLRLDSHDGEVPDEVWNAFGKALPRAKNLRAVVLEWFPEAMDEAAGRQFARDFERARSMLC